MTLPRDVPGFPATPGHRYFPLAHFLLGLFLMYGIGLWASFRRRHNCYCLSDRAAHIYTALPVFAENLRSIAISVHGELAWMDGNPPTIKLARDRRGYWSSRYQANIGFERIADARYVFDTTRQLQRGAP